MSRGRGVLLAGLALVFVLAATAHAAPFNNCGTTESAINAASTVILCDDFQQGTEIEHTGWQTCASFLTATSGYVISSGGVNNGKHVRGINIAPDGNAAPHNILCHTHATSQSGLTGLRVRFYVKLDPGYASNGAQKFISGQNSDHQGSLHIWRVGVYTPGMYLCPQQDCDNTGFFNPQTNGGTQGVNGWSCNGTSCQWLGHNLGNSLNVTANGSWFYVEWRIVLNTPPSTRNGIWQLWINDCGSTGVCTGSPTLRASYTNIIYRTTSETMGGFYLDNWGGNPADVGTLRFDQLVVATDAHGPIGFVGAPTTQAFSVLATAGSYALTGATTSLTQLAGPTLIGFVHRAALAGVIVALILIRRRTHVH